jgi:formylglycine-generating enzyme required for sulfatase activity/predicted Ser/Thr protein kinase
MTAAPFDLSFRTVPPGLSRVACSCATPGRKIPRPGSEMPQLLYILRSFRAGKLTQAELIAKVQALISETRTSVEDVLTALEDEHAVNPLPGTAFDALFARLRVAQNHTIIRTGRPLRTPVTAPEAVAAPAPPRAPGTAPRAAAHDHDDAASNEPAPPAWDPLLTGEYKGPTIQQGTMLVGRFGVVELLGEGGMSRVYKAVDMRKVEAGADDPHVAVKVLTVPFDDYTDAMAVLHRETEHLQGLNHPNIVRVIDCDRDGQTVFMTMEYLTGKTLNEIVSPKSFEGLARDEVITITGDIANALDYAHDRGILHGDLKPGNVIIAGGGVAKVIDFGIARMIGTRVRRKQRRGDEVGGVTPAYASPEMLEDGEPDRRDDVYALACIAWELFTGTRPYNRLNALEAREEKIRPEHHPKLSSRDYRALAHALELDRAKRTRTAQEFIDELTGVNHGAWKWRVAAVAGVAAVIASGAVVYFQRSAPQAAVRPPVPVAAPTPQPAAAPPAPTLSVGTVFRDCPTCPLMVVLPPGEFDQGAAADFAGSLPSELPAHRVTIAHSFAASQHEITVGEYDEFVKATARESAGCETYDGAWTLNATVSWKNAVEAQTALHPVSCVSWDDATAYAQWLSTRTSQTYRLPSASEWEYAARAGDTIEKPWDDDAAACTNGNLADQSAAQKYPGWHVYTCMDTYREAAPVGSFAINAFGLNDTLGNVFEWTADCWHDNYSGAPVDGSAWRDGDCSQHELRGGSWFTSPEFVRTSYRNRFATDYRSTSVGIRLVRETGS